MAQAVRERYGRRTSSTADRASKAVMSAFRPVTSALPPRTDVVQKARLGLLLTLSRHPLSSCEALPTGHTPADFWNQASMGAWLRTCRIFLM